MSVLGFRYACWRVVEKVSRSFLLGWAQSKVNSVYIKTNSFTYIIRLTSLYSSLQDRMRSCFIETQNLSFSQIDSTIYIQFVIDIDNMETPRAETYLNLTFPMIGDPVIIFDF